MHVFLRDSLEYRASVAGGSSDHQKAPASAPTTNHRSLGSELSSAVGTGVYFLRRKQGFRLPDCR